MNKQRKECWCSNAESKRLSELEGFLKLIADKNRLRIICLLSKERELCVCEIFKKLELSQNLASHHLKKLRDTSLLSERKDGVFVFYSINETELKKYEKLLNKIITKQNK